MIRKESSGFSIRRSTVIFTILLVALSTVLFRWIAMSVDESKDIPGSIIPITQTYSFAQCKTCDNDGCLDSSLFSKISVNHKKKTYSLYSVAKNGKEIIHTKNQSETCQFNLTENDPLSFSCQSEYRKGGIVGTVSVRLEHNRLTLEREHSTAKPTTNFHSTTTCPINFPLM